MTNRLNYLKYLLLFCTLTLLAPVLSSCLGEGDLDYDDWRVKNDNFVTEAREAKIDGKPEYEELIPVFAPETFILIKWHHDRELNKGQLSPLDNSTVDCKYSCYDIEGGYIDSSFASTAYGDSIYRTRPVNNIPGFWAALTAMHVGDSVTVVVPSSAGYGNMLNGKVKPYSALIYNIKLKGIPAFELPE